MSGYPDIPVACEISGLVMLLEKVVDPMVLEFSVQKVFTEQLKALIEGFPCPACRVRFDVVQIQTGVELQVYGKATVVPTGKASCKYRPLRGPLYVPR